MKSYIFQFLIGTNNFIKVKDEKLYHLSTYYSSHFSYSKSKKIQSRICSAEFCKDKGDANSKRFEENQDQKYKKIQE